MIRSKKLAATPLVVAFLFTGCATTPQIWVNPSDKVYGYSLLEVDVEISEDAYTGMVERLDDLKKGEFAEEVKSKLEAALNNAIEPSFLGSMPARVLVHVDEMVIASGVGRAVLGNESYIGANVRVVDVDTNTTIAERHFRAGGDRVSFGGVLAVVEIARNVGDAVSNDRVEAVAGRFAQAVNGWLPAYVISSGDGPGGGEGSDGLMSCSEMLADQHIRNADTHGSVRYRALVRQYRDKQCPAPDFHNARIGAVNQRNIRRLSPTDRVLSCHELLAEKTRLDELIEWQFTREAELQVLRFRKDNEGGGRIGRGDFSEMTVRASGLDSLYDVNSCDSVLSHEKKTQAKEIYRAPLRYARRNLVRQKAPSEIRRTYGSANAVDSALSCDELVREIRLEEDNRVYRHGTYSRTIVSGGSAGATAVGALAFGPAGAALGLLLDAQSIALAKRMTKREGRLLDQLDRKSCYYELAVNPGQQTELSVLVEDLTEEDRALGCDEIRNGAVSSMSRFTEELQDAGAAAQTSFYELFWRGRDSGAISDRDAGLIVLAELRGCHAEDT